MSLWTRPLERDQFIWATLMIMNDGMFCRGNTFEMLGKDMEDFILDEKSRMSIGIHQNPYCNVDEMDCAYRMYNEQEYGWGCPTRTFREDNGIECYDDCEVCWTKAMTAFQDKHEDLVIYGFWLVDEVSKPTKAAKVKFKIDDAVVSVGGVQLGSIGIVEHPSWNFNSTIAQSPIRPSTTYDSLFDWDLSS